MPNYDEIAIHRPELARGYLALLQAQPGRPIAMFAPRRVGKTYFLDHDLAPLARDNGLLPVYADLWLQRTSPLQAINHALEEALDDLAVPQSRVGKLARTPIKKLGALGASLDLGEPPTRRALPEVAELRLDALVTRVVAAAGKPVLLLLDEVQALGDVASGESVVAALRAVLHKRRAVVQAVFTGSSQEALARMVATAGAPMYQFAQMLDFPVLGDAFLQRLAKHYARVHPGKQLVLDDLRRLFARIGFKPALMKDIVKAMSAEGVVDVDAAVLHFLKDDRHVAGWRALLQSLDAFERGLLQAIAQGLPPMGRSTLDALAARPGAAPPTIAKVRSAIVRLRRTGILAGRGAGAAQIEDPLLREYLVGAAGLAEAAPRLR